MSAETRTDIYTRVTDRIVADLEQGVRAWAKPWNAEHGIPMPVRHGGERYRGINVLLLWSEATAHGYAQPVWMTFKQALELKAHVRKGERGCTVVYADRFTKVEADQAGNDVEHTVPFLKSYTVFNVEQIDGMPERYFTRREAPAPLALIEGAEAFFAATGATIRHTGSQAYYSPSTDTIVMPSPDAFQDAESYAATKAHELAHWTKHPSRLARDLGGKTFGDDGYAREELVAELAAAFLCAELEISAAPREDHASYLSHWLGILKTDKRAIFQAAAHAQKATDFLRGLQPGATPS